MNLDQNDHDVATDKVNYQIALLEEKLHVTRQKHKVGEVIVRKEVQTKLVQVPIRREILVVERTGQEPAILSEVVLGADRICGFQYEELKSNHLHMSNSSFLDIATAHKLLQEILSLPAQEQTKIRIEIAASSPQQTTEHQDICDRYI